MQLRKLALRAVLLLVGAPLALVLLAGLAFFALFYFPNRGRALPCTLVVAGQTREYLLYVPKSYDRNRPAPLVLSLHPAMSWPSAEMAISRWNEVADAQGALIAYPAGPGGGPKVWIMKRWERPEDMPDLRFLTALIDHLESTYAIDPRRIYVDGLSNGGGMAFALACAESDRIAAVGMVAAARSLDWDWHPGHRPVPMIAFHGTADPVAPYGGGKTPVGPDVFPSVESFTAAWARRNGCAEIPRTAEVAPGVKRRQYLDPAGDARVVLYTLEGGGHQWPGGHPLPAFLAGPYRRDLDATALMWAFFQAHPLPAPATAATRKE